MQKPGGGGIRKQKNFKLIIQEQKSHKPQVRENPNIRAKEEVHEVGND